MKKLILFTAIWLCFSSMLYGQNETEPNNNAGQANILMLNTGYNGSLSGTDVDDWYILNLTQGGILTFTVHKTGTGNARMYLLDAEKAGFPEISNLYLEINNSPAEGWTLSYSLLPGNYYIHFLRYDPSVSYSVIATFAVSNFGQDIEPNHSAAMAQNLNVPGSVGGTLRYYRPNDGTDQADWYKMIVPQGGILQLKIDKKGPGNVWIRFHDGEKSGLQEVSNYYTGYSESPPEGLNWSYPVLAGTYYFQVVDGEFWLDYKLEVTLTIPEFTEDAESNNTAQEATNMLWDGSVSGIIRHYGAGEGVDFEDWYKMVVPQGGILNLKIHKKGPGNVWIRFRDGEKSNFQEVSNYYTGYSESPPEGWSWNYPVLAGIYYFQVVDGENWLDYKLESSMTLPGFQEDTEPNNSFASATNMLQNASVSGIIRYYAAGEGVDFEDWYKIEVSNGGFLNLKIHKKGPGNVWIRFRDGEKAGLPELSNFYTGYEESPAEGWIWRYPVLEGTYYFQLVDGENRVEYKLDALLTSPEWGEDTEPNDSLNVAQVFAVNDSIAGLLGYYKPGYGFDDWDWYIINTTKKGLLSFNISKKGNNNGNVRLRSETAEIATNYLNFGDLTTSVSKVVPAGIYYLGFEKYGGDIQYKVLSNLLPVPVANFTYLKSGNVVAFENTTQYPETMLWNFDDNTTSTTINAYKEYNVPKNYNVCLIATNPAGADTICKTIIIPGVERILPAEGGNTGDVTVQVFGGGLDTNFVGKIMNGATNIATSINTSFADNSSIFLRFDLRNKPLGTYDFVIEKKGGSPSYKLTNGFRVLIGTKPNVWANIIGRDRILFNTQSSYVLNFGNKGNVDAVVAPIWLAVYDSPNLVVQFPEAIEINTDTLNLGNSLESYVLLDSLYGKPGKWRVYSFLFPVIKAGSNNAMKMKIKTSENLKIHVWTETPWFQSPIDPTKQECMNEAIDSVDVKLLAEFLKECVKSACSDAFYKMRTYHLIYGGLNYQILGILTTSFENVVYKATYNCGLKGNDDVTQSIRKAITKQVIEHFWNQSTTSRSILNNNIDNRDFETCPPKPQNPTSTSATAVQSLDPNEKAGPSGFGHNNYLRSSNGFPYTIYFENKSTATAPAHQIAIIDNLDPAVFDLNSFSFGKVTIGDSTIYVPAGLRAFIFDKEITNLNVIARVSGKLDTINGNIEWLFRSLDPKTLDDVEDPDIGILPPNTKSPIGEGNVNYYVQLKNEPRHDQKVKNKASIIFDANPAIVTNEHVVTFDLLAPESSVAPLPATTHQEKVTINWSGTDSGSGLKNYNVYLSTPDIKDSLWIANTTDKSAEFKGEVGSTYSFFSIAVDNAGNIETSPTTPDAEISFLVATDDPDADQKLQVYPNPTNDLLNIVSIFDISGIFCISDIHGKVITSLQITGTSKNQLSLRDWPVGVYFWKLTNQSGAVSTGKVMVSPK